MDGKEFRELVLGLVDNDSYEFSKKEKIEINEIDTGFVVDEIFDEDHELDIQSARIGVIDKTVFLDLCRSYLKTNVIIVGKITVGTNGSVRFMKLVSNTKNLVFGASFRIDGLYCNHETHISSDHEVFIKSLCVSRDVWLGKGPKIETVHFDDDATVYNNGIADLPIFQNRIGAIGKNYVDGFSINWSYLEESTTKMLRHGIIFRNCTFSVDIGKDNTDFQIMSSIIDSDIVVDNSTNSPRAGLHIRTLDDFSDNRIYPKQEKTKCVIRIMTGQSLSGLVFSGFSSLFFSRTGSWLTRLSECRFENIIHLSQILDGNEADFDLILFDKCFFSDVGSFNSILMFECVWSGRPYFKNSFYIALDIIERAWTSRSLSSRSIKLKNNLSIETVSDKSKKMMGAVRLIDFLDVDIDFLEPAHEILDSH